MGSSSSSTSSSTSDDPDCYIHNKMIRQQCLQPHPNQEYITPKPYFDGNNNNTDTNRSSTQQPVTYIDKTQIGCDCQGNVVECDENGRIIRVIKSNNR
ncbi:unnamed protein product [Adineta steineri]|uniref:Uncharacterized protein n=1 Tax=Adineta steineri TaxID=433720 RepID=A0A814Y342_9BILA|nr:unnamed protein product [Adineta steineri]